MNMRACVVLGVMACAATVLAGAGSIEGKLETIRLPDVKLDQVPLPEALNRINRMAVEADPETDPLKKGVGFVFLPRAVGRLEQVKVTVDLKKPTLGEALAAVTKQGGYGVVVVPNGLKVIPTK